MLDNATFLGEITSAGSIAGNHVAAAGARTIIVIAVRDATPTGVSVNSVPLDDPEVIAFSAGLPLGVLISELIDTSAGGTFAISVDFSSVAGFASAWAVSIVGAVAIEASFGTADNAEGASINDSVTTVTEGAFILDVVASASTGPFPAVGGSQTALFNANASDGNLNDAVGVSYRIGGAPGSHAMQWTAGDSVIYQHGIVAVEVVAEDPEPNTPIAAQNANVERPLDVNTIVRFLIQADGDPDATQFKLKAQKNGSGGYVDVPVGTSGDPELFIAPSDNIAASGAGETVQRLAGGTGTFVAGRIADDVNQLPSINIGEDGNTEIAWNLRIQSPAEAGDYWDLRVYAGDTPLDAYDQTARITVAGGGEAAGAITLGPIEVAGALSGLGEMQGAASFGFALAGDIGAVGQLSTVMDISFSVSGEMGASGDLLGDIDVLLGVAGNLDGAGALAGSVGLEFLPQGLLSSDGPMDGDVALTLALQGEPTGGGALEGDVPLELATSGALSGAGALEGSATLDLDVTGAMSGGTDLQGSIDLSLDATGEISGAGALTGDIDVALTVAGDLSGESGAMAGSIQMALAMSGELAGGGALESAISILLSVNGAMVDGSFDYMDGQVSLSLGVSGGIDGFYPIDGARQVNLGAYGLVTIYTDGNGKFFTI